MATYHLKVKNDTQPSGTKVSAKRHVDYILRKDGKAHADYINREGFQSNRDDCIFKGCQLPKWAKSSPQKFFDAATRYEDKRNRRYKEIELSLPNELSLEQNRGIVDRFIANHLSNHYYAYAIHEKNGELSGQRHPHVHIMFSERIIDDVEKVSERPAYKYFRRAAKPLQGEQVASFQRRREHGAPKDKKWHDKHYLIQIRADFAQIQNEVLAKYGFSVRVDHRSLQAQKEEAENKGDEILAKVYDRKPEKYIGIMSAHLDNESVKNLLSERMQRQEKEDALFRLDFQKKMELEIEVQELVTQAEIALFSYSKANQVLPKEVQLELEQIQNLKKSWQKVHTVTEKVLAEYLTLAERKLLINFKNKMGEKRNLQSLLQEISQPTETQVQNLQAYEEIIQAIAEKICCLDTDFEKIRPKVLEVEKELDNVGKRKNIWQVIHNNLQSNLETLNQLKAKSVALLNHIKNWEQIEPSPVSSKKIFSFSEVERITKQQYYALRSQYKERVAERNALKLKVISASRAISMAKNVFVQGAFKELRIKENQCRKLSKKYERDCAQYQKQEESFKATDWKDDGQRIQACYYLTKDRIRLEGIRRKILTMNKQIKVASADLEKRCGTPKAKQTIGIIAARILRKNLKYVREYEKTTKCVKEISKSVQLFKKRLANLKENVPKKMKKCYYQVISADNATSQHTHSTMAALVSIIADALNHEPAAMAQVVCFSGDDLMQKDWEWLTEFEKDELMIKKIIRDL